MHISLLCTMLSRWLFLLCSILMMYATATPAVAQYWQRVTLQGQYASNFYLDVTVLPSNPQYVWACGFNGAVVRSTDAGATWQGSTVPFGNRGSHLEHIIFLTTQTGYCSGPAGIFKSVNGGASWFDITPAAIGAPWGCTFESVDYGVLIGGDCSGGTPVRNQFFRTTNGGGTWTQFQDSTQTTATGLTDALIYSDGTGYAVSSGRIWFTADSAKTWTVVITSGSAVWNEELARIGSSFCIPYAGTECSGGGVGGGVWFTTNAGTAWQRTALSQRMYGTYLTSPIQGWACGSNRTVLYSEDAGESWQSRNCGTSGDLDDISIVNDSTGYVVGNGVYRIEKASRIANKSLADFGVFCPPAIARDTIRFINRSWYSSDVTLSISGANASDFRLLSPAPNNAINSCDTLYAILEFRPSSPGQKIAQLTAVFPSNNGVPRTQISIALRGQVFQPTSVIIDTLLTLNQAPVGIYSAVGSIRINNSSASDTERVSRIVRVDGALAIAPGVSLPLNILPNSTANIPFGVTPIDTGWVEGRFRITLEPCSRDTFVTVRAYGVSPILNIQNTAMLESTCLAMSELRLPVRNTGNADLVINRVTIPSGSTDVAIVGWETGENPLTQVRIRQGVTNYLIIRFTPNGSVRKQVLIYFDNNDATTARSMVNPFPFTLTVRSNAPRIALTPTTLDLGDICLGSSKTLKSILANSGTLNGDVRILSQLSREWLARLQFSTVLATNGTSDVTVTCTPTREGELRDTLVIIIDPCRDTLRLALRANAVSTRMNVQPSIISEIITAGQTLDKDILLRALGSTNARITSIILQPQRSDWQLLNVPALPTTMTVDELLTMKLRFQPTGATQTQYQGQICITVSQVCDTIICIPINAVSTRSEVRVVGELLYAANVCNNQAQTDTLYVENRGTDSDTLRAITILPTSPAFRIIQPTNAELPIVLLPNTRVPIVVEAFLQNQGIDTAIINIFLHSSPLPVTRFASVEFRASTLSAHLDNLSNGSQLQDTIDYGLLEECDTNRTLDITIKNSGLLGDSIWVEDRTPTENGVTISSRSSSIDARTASVDGRTVFTLTTMPSVATSGNIAKHYRFHSASCPWTYNVFVKAQTFRPSITLAPAIIDFDTLWQNSQGQREVYVINTSPKSQTVTSLYAGNDPVDANRYTITPERTLPTILGSGDTLRAMVTVFADSIGNTARTLYVNGESLCKDSAQSSVQAVVPEELYIATIRAGLRVVRVNTVADVPVVLTTRDGSRQALSATKLQSIRFTVRFDPRVMIIENVFARNGRDSLTLPYKLDYNRLSLTVNQTQSSLLGRSDTLFWIHARGSLGVSPALTDIILDSVALEMPVLKPTQLQRFDGTFAVTSCTDWSVIDLGASTQIHLQNNPVNDGIIHIATHSTANATLRLTLTSLYGNICHEQPLFIASGESEQSIATHSLASGWYMMSVMNTATGYTTHIPFILAK